MALSGVRRWGIAIGAGLLLAAGAVTAAVGAGVAGPRAGAAPDAASSVPKASVHGAYQFLNQMLDRYATGSVPRLAPSFTGGVLGSQGFTASSIYDDALMIDAYLAERTPGGLARAMVIGDGLRYAQANGPSPDGRLLSSYAPVPLATPADVQARDTSSGTGAMAWAGQALTQLYAATGTKSYLAAAVAIGGWIQAHCSDHRGAGGYTGGYSGSGAKIEWKSTENNIDVYAFFRLLARETGDPAWSGRAAGARQFIVSMWEPAAGTFYLGTASDGTTPNAAAQAEDVSSWSYLALRDPAYAGSVSWAVRNLAVTAGGFTGVSVCRGDRTGVWFEGAAHLADALEFRRSPGDSRPAATYLASIGHAQLRGPNADGLGIMAASKDQLSDCLGGYVYASLHTGTTAWYILAAQGVNPLAATPIWPVSGQPG